MAASERGAPPHAGWPRRRWLTVGGGGALLWVAGLARGQTARPAPIAQPAGRDRAGFARRALELRDEALRRGDQPYGAVVVRNGEIVGEGVSAVVTDRDPTAHAEMLAIRSAAQRLGTPDLAGCELYGSSRACPMCEAAAYWANLARMYHGIDAADAGAPKLRG
jgi:tRNA(Arg) A34 adenosine deaminase TadA